MDNEFSFKVTQRIAVLYRSGDYSLELNMVSYRDNPPKLDLRKWNNGKPLKGVTMTAGDALALRDALNSLDLAGGEP